MLLEKLLMQRCAPWLAVILFLVGGCRAADSATDPILPALRISTTSLPDGVRDEAYGALLTAVGGDGSYSWAVTGGGFALGADA